ncbi:hypothetical protein [Rhodanobacter ginsengiterrae]|uniref:hypothetical protein n=1 Tax=Rhodanobacter ginsengiterrae TaxID=2008451 RepID=UPI003CF940A1
MKKVITLIIACATLVACVPSKPFVMPNVDRQTGVHVVSEYATGTADSMFSPHILIASIDGKPVKRSSALARLPEEVYVTPGTHTFDLRYVMGGGWGEINLALDAQAGHEYIIEEIDGTGAHFLLRFRDGWNGPVVGRLAD